jgi:hypothetical protein
VKKLKQFWRSRTIKVSTLIAMLGALEASQPFLKDLLPAGSFGTLMIALALVMAYLRSITVEAIKDKQ